MVFFGGMERNGTEWVMDVECSCFNVSFLHLIFVFLFFACWTFSQTGSEFMGVCKMAGWVGAWRQNGWIGLIFELLRRRTKERSIMPWLSRKEKRREADEWRIVDVDVDGCGHPEMSSWQPPAELDCVVSIFFFEKGKIHIIRLAIGYSTTATTTTVLQTFVGQTSKTSKIKNDSRLLYLWRRVHESNTKNKGFCEVKKCSCEKFPISLFSSPAHSLLVPDIVPPIPASGMENRKNGIERSREIPVGK